MWRSLKQAVVKPRFYNKVIQRHYSNEVQSIKSAKKVLIVATTGVGLATFVIYSKSNPELKSLLKGYVPYIDEIYKVVPDIGDSKKTTPNMSMGDKKESSISRGSLKEPGNNKASSKSQKSDPPPPEIELRSKESSSVNTVEKIVKELDNSETKLKSVESETHSEYQSQVNQSKEEMQQKLEIMLPNYVYGLTDKKSVTESDLNNMVAEAHQQIEQLQKKLAKQKVTEKMRLDEALQQQQLNNKSAVEAKIETELEKRNVEIEMAVAREVASLKESFDSELRKLLHSQAAAHFDHIQEILKIQEQELERKYSLDLEDKILHMKGVFTLEMSDKMDRLKKISLFLKAKSELDVESKKAQSLWLVCQSLGEKIYSDAGSLSPLESDIASIKVSANGGNAYINTVLSGIPNEAVTRGVCSPEALKHRFHNMKKVCQKVALINEGNDSLYQYLLSYIQSYLIIDEISIPKAEVEGKVAVDPSEWDTFDILSRISYSLKTDDLEQALRYANQLKGEARAVAKDWVKELRLFLETKMVVKALSAHAAAISVQAYH